MTEKNNLDLLTEFGSLKPLHAPSVISRSAHAGEWAERRKGVNTKITPCLFSAWCPLALKAESLNNYILGHQSGEQKNKAAEEYDEKEKT